MELFKVVKPLKRDLTRLNALKKDRPNPQLLRGSRTVVVLDVNHTDDKPPLRTTSLRQGCKVFTVTQQSSFTSRLRLSLANGQMPEMNWIVHAEQYLGSAKHILVVRHERDIWDTTSEDFCFHKDVTCVGRNCCDNSAGSILVLTTNSIPSWIQLVAGDIYYRVCWIGDGIFPKIVGRASRNAKKITIGVESTVEDVKVLLGGLEPWVAYLTNGSRPLVDSVEFLFDFFPDSERLLRQSLNDPEVRDSVIYFSAAPNNPLTLLTSEAEGARQIGRSFSTSDDLSEPSNKLVILVSQKLQELTLKNRSGGKYIIRDIHSDMPVVECV